ncbi:DUF1146 domain-containing protein [Tumebacillus sp. ITR2]|uniref:DUF1146 domain-containing protein n=1 Tax=Tumebacillus amylolyticus TaxID=2801339 RepID=A0ABS1J599_9BACL|nr:DUF1146 domain-containing protein [Tumebacillus amylolyticus]MBL0385456.1 DUF1146 domain-containing protein [Tumebacillus amylolyticus]
MPLEQVATDVGWMAGLNMVLLLFGILIAWYSLQAVRWDVFVKDPKGRPAAVLRLLLSVTLGYSLMKFVSDYVSLSSMLKHLF